MNAKQIIMARAEIVADRVQAGWSLLDAHKPCWRANMDDDSVDLDDAFMCVLGQAFREEWESSHEEHARRVQAWYATDQSTARPTEEFDSPFSYGLAQLIIASGAQVDIVEQRNDFARRHGFLTGMLRAEGWHSVTSEELADAWTWALRDMEWGQR